MCGIVGWIDWGEVDLTRAGATKERMAETLSHRGPDARGSWLSPRAALAHRRLIVLDPQGGSQPMLYQAAGDHTYALTYNGEIYNFMELRGELELHGHTFRTRSDTEVLLHAYVEWGEECVLHLNGIFAFGLWDQHQQKLLLARDHLGIKPLFYAQRGSSILFGSELKALLAHPSIAAEVDATGLADLFSFRRAPGSAVFRAVRELRAGHIAICTRQQTRVVRYWDLRSAPHTEDLAMTAEHIGALLDDIVKRQIVADVPVGAMLSGGLDSSALAALAAREFRLGGRELHTYALDFADNRLYLPNALIPPSSQDADWSQRVAGYLAARHHVIKVEPAALVANLLAPMHAHDLPAMGQMESSLLELFRAMKRDTTVTLSGEGADEVFGGYPWFHRDSLIHAPLWPLNAARSDSSSPPETTNVPLPTAPMLWRDWPRCGIRRTWIKVVRSQTISLESSSPLSPVLPPAPTEKILTRAERAHWRLSWQQRLARNAPPADAPRLVATLYGLPATFASAFGFNLLATA